MCNRWLWRTDIRGAVHALSRVRHQARRDLVANTSLWLCWRGLRQRTRDSYVNYYTLWLGGATKTTPNTTKNIQRRKIALNLLPSLLIPPLIIPTGRKLSCSFFNRVISLYIYYDQYEKRWRKNPNFFSHGWFPRKWRPYSILGHLTKVHITLKPLLQIQLKLHTHRRHMNEEMYTSVFSFIEYYLFNHFLCEKQKIFDILERWIFIMF